MRDRNHWPLALLFLVLVVRAADAEEPDGAAPAEPAAPPPAPSPVVESDDPTWYAQALARGDAGLNVTNFWSKGARMRSETIVGGHKIVTLVNGAYYYAYDALGGKGIAIRRSPDAIALDAVDRRPFGTELERLVRQGAEKVREELVRGAPVEIYRVTDRRGSREVWVTHDDRQLPVRMKMYQRHTGSRLTTDYLNWISGLPISDRFFEADPQVALRRFGLEEYLERQARREDIGPVPVLYADLLKGP